MRPQTLLPRAPWVLLYYTNSAKGEYLLDWKIALDPDLLNEPKRELHHTIAHELTHLIQWQQNRIRHRALQTKYAYLYAQKIPKGEEACDIWTYARHPDLVAPSGYLHTPFEMRKGETSCEFWNRKFRFYEKHCNEIHELAKKAIELRARGCRRYIKWFLDELRLIL
ncbi:MULTISPECIES: hypothetical protein [unclassified Archaeoglobus]|jgi:hypothetical protein|uniref:hypothetical protein n=1 Tax=unclassified Archaeoglobus TaxID=2643606 RepID=UPI0025BB0765|nr:MULTISPECIES: hypothetical protein [unclassified Archaeoglobus]